MYSSSSSFSSYSSCSSSFWKFVFKESKWNNNSRPSSSISISNSSPSSSVLGALDQGGVECRRRWGSLGLVSESRDVSDLFLFLLCSCCHSELEDFFYGETVVSI